MNTDAELRCHVVAELEFEPRLHDQKIDVTVKDGKVVLTGSVSNYIQRLAAERAAYRVLRVQEVENNIAIAPGSYSDEDISRAVTHALEWNIKVPRERIKFQVDKGQVTLTGEVDWHYQKMATRNAVECLAGVRSVIDLIGVKSAITPAEIKSQIEAALRRNAKIDADQITVITEGGKVILEGHVQSWSEREEAVRTAWSAAGVTQVDEFIQIRP